MSEQSLNGAFCTLSRAGTPDKNGCPAVTYPKVFRAFTDLIFSLAAGEDAGNFAPRRAGNDGRP